MGVEISESREVLIEPRAVDEMRPLRVRCIGAGISGIIASIRFPQRITNLDFQIYEKNSDISGTWFENRYPGCACDIPAHTYQLSFEPNLEWSQFYASAPEIHRYWKKVVKKYGCMQYIKLNHKVIEARWDGEQSKWLLQVEDTTTGSIRHDFCDVLLGATGSLNTWKWPTIPGLHDFKGKLLHSANWDQSWDYSNQRVAVIGNGSSAIQIVPGIQKSVKHIDHFARGKTWIAQGFAAGKVKEQIADHGNYKFTTEDIDAFKQDPKLYQEFRKAIELELQSGHGLTLRGSVEQAGATAEFTKNMTIKLAKKPEILKQLLPSFPPACRRLTPGPGYLEALVADNVDVIPDQIVRIDADGIITADGKHRPVDAIVCATGFDTSHLGTFPIIGKDGLTLAQRWAEVPETYLSFTTDGFPNYFIFQGPQSGLGTGNLLILLERLANCFTTLCLKMQRDNIAAMEVKPEAVKSFVRFCDKYFERTVFSMKCRSWYKNGKEEGRVNALWPGSSLHALKTLGTPRFEDFQYNYCASNPMGWFGDGWTENEKKHTIIVDYLDDENMDFPPVASVENGELTRVENLNGVLVNGMTNGMTNGKVNGIVNGF